MSYPHGDPDDMGGGGMPCLVSGVEMDVDTGDAGKLSRIGEPEMADDAHWTLMEDRPDDLCEGVILGGFSSENGLHDAGEEEPEIILAEDDDDAAIPVSEQPEIHHLVKKYFRNESTEVSLCAM